ncbi:MAG: bifunctional DNA-formamidopyrimidine glycosylase/DNA-(apurinic or apyrimidinic site) lyase [Gammaproteobacteria bacterium]|nr:bifunctional DNA-formamidopyrimidine glycosylase/DNA-(apurinic or apyrimidinic site) lyase [Gammaproteobacteria bacterium]MBU1442608.1 bifunctional DNA-formamidopyrimidine glycosylase/DNA-(apurinic or apyrimidinic site) lyase [Gammaproteobacteria bacterium]MBU2286917.1 bifunctional DNA-formamidopyrimidine glycosylase/DNA-(apurinic or apyrimidinic site) lyase [Gammaproteobacteria bacterium]MBU2410058.1 bifunctional DNA-formamidopyrimidine glycosylase/DNA-(apurinic or apyrimidinic site) lyase [
MPELPEVEVTRLGFADRIAGATIEEVRLGKPLRWALAVDPAVLVGRRIVSVRRRGKYLLADLDIGVLLMHLGMSGSLRFAQALPPGGKHDHFDMVTDQGVLRLNDPRRFGAIVYVEDETSPQALKLLGGLGMEPLGDEFDIDIFHAGLRKRRSPIKQVLLLGDVVVGVGNIYASEALFLAGIRPTVLASRISRPRAARLRDAVRDVLSRAVERGGSTLRDFSNAEGQAGYFQLEAAVYGRGGEPCRVCLTPIRQMRQGQRSTYFCPKCQKY